MHVFEKNSNIFNLLSEGVSEGIIVVNAQQIIVATNTSAEHMFGYTKKELIGKPLETLMPKRFHNNHVAQVKHFIAKSDKRQMGHGRELFGICKNGHEFPLEAGLNPFKLYGATYVMALVIDITERKIKEKELSHWARIFDESLNEIYVFDADSLKFTNVNKEAQRNIGYTMKELTHMTPVDIKPELTKKKFEKLIQPLIGDNLGKIQFETEHKRKDGSTYPVEVHVQLSVMGAKKTFVAIILDISERRNYTQKLEKKVAERTLQLTEALTKEKELNELKTRFLSLVSHEFKTPLSSILTSITLLGKYTETAQQEKRNKHVNTIKNKVKYLDSILNDFLSIEKLESGKIKYNIERFHLSKIINEVVYNSNLMLKAGQKIQYPENIDSITIQFDEKTLKLALSNLVHNAIKYSPEESIIEVMVTTDTTQIVIKVIDQGIGIPEEEQKHIFERYFRSKNALLTQGTGIGLNIAKQQLENLGARIEFTSKENNGSIFTINIPKNLIPNSK